MFVAKRVYCEERLLQRAFVAKSILLQKNTLLIFLTPDDCLLENTVWFYNQSGNCGHLGLIHKNH